MSKFNEAKTLKTFNKSGHAAYALNDKERLATQVLTSFFNEQKYYGDNSAEIIETLQAVTAKEPEFVAKLGVFARYEFNMRSISHVIGAVLAHTEQGKPYTRQYVKKVCRRADDMTEMLACYIAMFGKPIPNSLKKGLNDTLGDFDEYALAKYDRDGAVKIRDMIQLTHPAPKNEAQQALWKKALERSLQTPLTWETELSARGNNKETWEKLIAENALGYMAMLRNLRNILKADPANLDDVYQAIADRERVRKSRVLPFRFYSAYQEVRNHPQATGKTIDTLEAAISASVSNLEQIPGKTLIAIDVSGSMGNRISAKSQTTCRDIACLIGAMANQICEDSFLLTFDTKVRKHLMASSSGILQSADAMRADGGGTNIHLPFTYLLEHGIKVDRVILLSDNEVNYNVNGYPSYFNRKVPKPVQQSVDACRRALNPDLWVHAIDLQGYGTQQFIGERTNIIAGWNEKVLSFILLAERGAGSLIEKIEQTAI